jgi:hypothetical protein
MINTENISGNVIRITVPETLHANDFKQLYPQIEGFIHQFKKIRLLVDAENFSGWEDMKAFEKHMGFVKQHHHSVERIALIAGHAWQHWLVGIFRIFVHPEVRVFDKNEKNQAMEWVKS